MAKNKKQNQPQVLGSVPKKSHKAAIIVVIVVLLIIGFLGFRMLTFFFPPTFIFGLFSEFSGSDNETDMAIPDNLAKDKTGQPTVSPSGTCSPEYMQSMADKIQAGGAGSQAAQQALENCLNTDWLKNLCDNDPVKLRRAYFEERIAAAKKFDEKIAEKIELLMNECQARYRFRGEGVDPGSSGGVTIFSSLDANVCGYVDDEWTGKQIYRITAGPGSSHEFEGAASFMLPSSGGQFSGTSRGENAMAIGGTPVAIPNFDFGFTGNFDGVKTIQNLNLYPNTTISGATIELQEKPCVPLVPLSGGTKP